MEVDASYSWCHQSGSQPYIFLSECVFVEEVWRTLGLYNQVRTEQNDTVVGWLREFFKQYLKINVRWLAWCVGDCGGEEINGFGRKHVCRPLVSKEMDVSMLTDWRKENVVNNTTEHSRTARSKNWTKPPEGWVKINIDEACQQNDAFIGVGCISRDDRGGFLRARASKVRGRGYAREVAQGLC